MLAMVTINCEINKVKKLGFKCCQTNFFSTSIMSFLIINEIFGRTIGVESFLKNNNKEKLFVTVKDGYCYTGCPG